MRAFVTVGTTKFEDLIKLFEQTQINQTLLDLGYTSLVIQFGRGEEAQIKEMKGLQIETYRFKPSLADDFRSADLIISHAGAGSCLEALALGKKLIVVVNEKLMDNHQSELAHALAQKGHLVATNCQGLVGTLQGKKVETTIPYPQPDPKMFGRLMDQEFGF